MMAPSLTGAADAPGPLGAPPVPVLLALAALTAAALGLTLRAWWRSHRRRRLPALRGATRGTATLEFALVFPIVLGLTLILLQTTLVMAGQLFVHYAAFTATRSAAVYIPSDQSLDRGLPRNMIAPTPGTPKFDAIRRAALIALMPVSGEVSAGGREASAVDGEALGDALAFYFRAHGRTPPAWVRDKAADRLRYAELATEITLLRTNAAGGEVTFTPLTGGAYHTFAPREPVTVRVAHRLNLSIPYARVVFADGRDEHAVYTRVLSQHTLTNEGIDPALPPPPDLPRRDQMQDDEEDE